MRMSLWLLRITQWRSLRVIKVQIKSRILKQQQMRSIIIPQLRIQTRKMPALKRVKRTTLKASISPAENILKKNKGGQASTGSEDTLLDEDSDEEDEDSTGAGAKTNRRRSKARRSLSQSKKRKTLSIGRIRTLTQRKQRSKRRLSSRSKRGRKSKNKKKSASSIRDWASFRRETSRSCSTRHWCQHSRR